MRVVFLYLVVVTVHTADIDWWKTSVMYQIYPRSFKDSDGDGIGDLNGITEKLQFLKETGIDAIWLSPFFLSPMYDFGYDITDYRTIAPEYGTMGDFKNLLKRANILGLRVLLDFVPNHTSNESDWFQKSEKREPGYEDYYVWTDGVIDNSTGELKPPNNWISTFGGSTWEYSPVRKQYYLHQFSIAQPDLNYRYYKIHEEMKDVMRFWLNMGVSGFRVDAITRLYEANPDNYGGVYPDEPRSGLPGATPDDYDYFDHIYTWDLDETYEVVYNWRDFLDEFTETQGEYKLMITEGYTNLHNIIRYYGTKTRNGSIPFNMRYIKDKNRNTTAFQLKKIIDRWMNSMPEGETANWLNGNHDEPRVASRVGVGRVDAMNMLVLILPGIAFIYQGEELGMTNGYVSWEDTKDPKACKTHDPTDYYKVSRDPFRTPYQWDNSTSADFSTNKTTWLPVADNYKVLNLAEQINNCNSHYHFFKDVITARKIPALQYGDLETRAISTSILVVTRRLQGAPVVLGIMNLEAEEQFVDLSSMKLLSDSLEVIVAGTSCPITKGTLLLKKNIHLPSFCSLLLQSVQNCC